MILLLGYSYPVPENPLTLPPPKTTPPSSGYSYPVPTNPLGRFSVRNLSFLRPYVSELPERARTGKVVSEKSSKNLLIIGLKHNDFDSYDPEEYDHNDPDYIDVSQNEIGKISCSNAFQS